MAQVYGDRFSSQSMADCEFCPPDGRRFRTMRQCSSCGKPLCLVCRPVVVSVPFLCPECGGGVAENALLAPQAVIERLTGAGQTVPYWLTVIVEQTAKAPKEGVDDLIAE